MVTQGKILLGADPGKSGAIAISSIVGDSLILRDVIDMPIRDNEVSGSMLRHEILKRIYPDECLMAVVEKVHSMPKQGVASTFSFGYGYGVLRGTLDALGFDITDVTPRVWKKSMGIGSDKELARWMALNRFEDKAHFFQRKKDHGRAEAALLTWYFWNEHIRRY